MMANNGKRLDEATNTETVGHEWDGIEELDTPMPRWWLWTFYLCIAFAVGYVVVYPAIPLADKGTEGVWGWTSRGELAREVQDEAKKKAPILAAIDAVPLEKLPDDPKLMQAAVAGGKAAFKVNCVQCHGSQGGGSKGYPNLNDDDWLWGGSLPEIHQTLVHGIRQPGDAQTRMSQMPSFGRDGILTPVQVQQVTVHVLSLSAKAKANATGAQLFAANCVACHGADGKGMRSVGAPNLADAIWLYGGKPSDVQASITNAHYGVMPAWGARLDPVTIKMLAAYVHSLGGGEDFKEVAPESASAPAIEGNEQN
jgi:cytochrome c oxidase cbb3-type subunit 3